MGELQRGSGGGGGGGSGGGGGLQIKDLWDGSITATANLFHALGTTPVPNDAIYLIWNAGAFSSGDNDGPAALSTWINAAKWRALTADTAGTTVGDGAGLIFVDWGATDIGDGTPDFARRDMVIGRTATNIPLMLTTTASESFHGASLKYVTFTDPAVPGMGDGTPILDATGGLIAANSENEGQIAIDRNTLIEYVSVERHHETTRATGTFANIGSRTDLDIVGNRFEVTATLDDFVYETFDNRFFVGTTIAAGRIGWVDDSPANALAGSLAVNTNAVHWLGEHYTDAEAVAQIHALADATEYFFFNELSEEIRTLDNSSWTDAGSPIVTYIWLPVRADPSNAHGGFVVDAKAEHHPPPGTPANARNIYFDPTLTPPKIWVPHDDPRPGTPPSATSTLHTSASAGYRGALFSPPSSHAVGDFYYDRTNHGWRGVAAGTTFYTAVSWSELKTFAETSGGDSFFNSDDVFLNEVRSSAQAAQIIENAGYDSAKDYYWIQAGTFQELNVFTAAVNNAFDVDYYGMNVGAYVPPPTAIWYMNGQTERWPNSYPYTQDAASNRLRIRWSGDDPDETPYGWDVPSIWPGAISGNLDGSANPAASTNNVVFSLEGGVWDIDVMAGTTDIDLVGMEFGLFLYQIQTGDDKVLACNSGTDAQLPGNFGSSAGTVIDLKVPDLTLDGTEQLYIMAFVEDNDENWRGFMKLTKKA